MSNGRTTFLTKTFLKLKITEALEDFLKNDYDWNSESQSFRTEAENVFGSNWKQEEAKAFLGMGSE